MTIQFIDLVKIYRKADFQGNELDHAIYHIETQQDLEELNLVSSIEYPKIFVEESELIIGKKVDLTIEQPISLGRIYYSKEEYIKSDLRALFSPLSEKPFYIVKGRVYSEDRELSDGKVEPEAKVIFNYKAVRELAVSLSNMCSYRDTAQSKLIFFGKKTFELFTEAKQEDIESFIKEIENFDEKKRSFITDLRNWLDNEDTQSHLDEKKSILSFVLNETFSDGQRNTILDVVSNIVKIYESIQGQYSLYLENFSYDKFVKKLEHNSDKFLSKTNDSISKLLPQFLAIPVLTVVPSALKTGHDIFIYAAILVYCIICYMALDSQYSVLKYIKEDVDCFEENGKVPLSLQKQWLKEKCNIDALIQKQRNLANVLYLVVVFCFFYALGAILMAIYFF